MNFMSNWYLYRKPDGHPDLSQHELPMDLFPGYRLISSSSEKPDVYGKVFNSRDELVPVDRGYVQSRRAAYPPIGDQLDALWKAIGPMLDDPDASAMLDRIRAVKDLYPKPSNG